MGPKVAEHLLILGAGSSRSVVWMGMPFAHIVEASCGRGCELLNQRLEILHSANKIGRCLPAVWRSRKRGQDMDDAPYHVERPEEDAAGLVG